MTTWDAEVFLKTDHGLSKPGIVVQICWTVFGWMGAFLAVRFQLRQAGLQKQVPPELKSISSPRTWLSTREMVLGMCWACHCGPEPAGGAGFLQECLLPNVI